MLTASQVALFPEGIRPEVVGPGGGRGSRVPRSPATPHEQDHEPSFTLGSKPGSGGSPHLEIPSCLALGLSHSTLPLPQAWTFSAPFLGRRQWLVIEVLEFSTGNGNLNKRKEC